MKTLLIVLAASLSLAACRPSEGERCNPLAFTDECQPNDKHLACVYPLGAACGIAYCCAVDSNGNIVDKNPSCQPDPAAAATNLSQAQAAVQATLAAAARVLPQSLLDYLK